MIAEQENTFLDRAGPFTLSALPPAPQDPSNQFSGDPDAIKLGALLFSDPGLSRTGSVSCATCHITNGKMAPNENLPAQGDRRFRSVMPIQGAGYQSFLFWDGRVDSLWAQALAPLEHVSEHGLTRTEVIAYVNATYLDDFGNLLGGADGSIPEAPASPRGDQSARAVWQAIPPDTRVQINRQFSDIGKFIAAFEQEVSISASQWDLWVEELRNDPINAPHFPDQVRRGFDLFIGKAKCSRCHSGPLFTDFDFHNTGLPARDGQPLDTGRQAGVLAVISDEFNCTGRYSDAGPEECPELDYINMSMDRSLGAFRTPSLRSVSKRDVLGHAGQISGLREMVEHYNAAPPGPHGNLIGARTLSELTPIGLTASEVDDLIAFLESI